MECLGFLLFLGITFGILLCWNQATDTIGMPRENEFESNLLAAQCSDSLLSPHKHSVETFKLCLTLICSKRAKLPEKIISTNSLHKICLENYNIWNSCRQRNHSSKEVNTNTNFNETSDLHKENYVNGNCSENFKPAATTTERTRLINWEITETAWEESLFSNSSTSRPSKLETTDSKISHSDVKDNKIRSRNDSKSPSYSQDSRLVFLDVPKGKDMRFHELELDREYLLFEAFSKLMAYLQPTGFPSDMLRDAINGQMPFHLLAIQILKIEFFGVIWILFWLIASLCLPFGVAVSLCCSQHRRLNEENSNIPSEKLMNRILGYSLHIMLILMISPIVLILAGNEQISRSISKSPTSASIIYEDVNTFLENTHMQISYVVTSSTDIAFEEIGKDLDAIQELLGKSYQQELASETGIEQHFVNLEELKTSTFKVANYISDLLEDCIAAKKVSILVREQLQKIVQQLTIARQQCVEQDRALCYTLEITGLEVDSQFENLMKDPEIEQLKLLSTQEDLSRNIEMARAAFYGVPEKISLETGTYISDIKMILNKRRKQVIESSHSLEVSAKSLSKKLEASQRNVTASFQRIADWDIWRWLSIIVLSSILSLTWGLLLCGAPCGCGLTSRTIPFLISGVAMSCITCLFAWGLGSLALLIAGHGQTMICDPLDDYPRYDVLAEFVDSGGVLYSGGLFEDVADDGENIRIADVLKQCQRNLPAYKTFHLYNEVDVEYITNYRRWQDLENVFSNFTIEDCTLEILSPALERSLQDLSTASAVNLTSHRLRTAAPTTKRDLSSFADQLNTVARQLSFPVSARKIDNIAFHAREVVHGQLQQLNEIKNEIVYKITSLEVLLGPLKAQVDAFWRNLRSVQFFLDNRSWKISEKVRKKFVSRIENRLGDLYNHVNVKVTQEIGKCRPLWEMFRLSRFYICKLIVDPLHGISFFCYFLVLLLLTIVPVVIKLVDYYREDVLPTRDYLMEDEGVWVSPESESPIQLREITPPEEFPVRPTTSAWVSPTSIRQPSPHRIPPPPTRSTTPHRWI